MKHYQDFFNDPATFAERVGDPIEFNDAMGRVTLAFSFLEEMLSVLAALFLGQDWKVVQVITAEMSFKQKVNLVSSLYKLKYADFVLEPDHDVAKEVLSELITLCFGAEQLRNQIVHSSYVGTTRVKTTAKSKRGLSHVVESLDANKVLDVADHIVSVGMGVQEFPLYTVFADRISGVYDIVRYEVLDENGKIEQVREFRTMPAIGRE